MSTRRFPHNEKPRNLLCPATAASLPTAGSWSPRPGSMRKPWFEFSLIYSQAVLFAEAGQSVAFRVFPGNGVQLAGLHLQLHFSQLRHAGNGFFQPGFADVAIGTGIVRSVRDLHGNPSFFDLIELALIALAIIPPLRIRTTY